MSKAFETFAAIGDQYHRCCGYQLRDHFYGRLLA